MTKATSDGMTYGQIAYEGYFERVDGHSPVSGNVLPEWKGIEPLSQEGWEAAAEVATKAWWAEFKKRGKAKR